MFQQPIKEMKCYLVTFNQETAVSYHFVIPNIRGKHKRPVYLQEN
jgi:hypothetical protein